MQEENKKTFPWEIGPAYKGEVGVRIGQIRRKLRMGQREFAMRLGVASNTVVSRLEHGQAETISFEVLGKLGRLADMADFTIEWVLTGQKISPLVAKDELIQAISKQMIEALVYGPGAAAGDDAAPPMRVAALVGPGFQRVYPEDLPADWRGRFVPVIGAAAAGAIDLDTTEAESTPPGWATDFVQYMGATPTAFAVEVTGDSMEPDYQDGDMAIVDGGQRTRSGICCVVIKRGAKRIVRLKKLSIRGGKATLGSLNPAYKAVSVAAKNVKAYKVVGRLPLVARRPPDE